MWLKNRSNLTFFYLYPLSLLLSLNACDLGPDTHSKLTRPPSQLVINSNSTTTKQPQGTAPSGSSPFVPTRFETTAQLPETIEDQTQEGVASFDPRTSFSQPAYAPPSSSAIQPIDLASGNFPHLPPSRYTPKSQILVDTYVDSSLGMKGFSHFFDTNLATLVNKFSSIRASNTKKRWFRVGNRPTRSKRDALRREKNFRGDSSLTRALQQIKKTISRNHSTELALLITDGMAPDQNSYLTDSCCQPDWTMRKVIKEISNIISNDISVSLHIIDVPFHGTFHMNCGSMNEGMTHSIESQYGSLSGGKNGRAFKISSYSGTAPLMVYVFSKHHDPKLVTEIHETLTKQGLPSSSIQIWPPAQPQDYEFVSSVDTFNASTSNQIDNLIRHPFGATTLCHPKQHTQTTFNFELLRKDGKSEESVYNLIDFDLEIIADSEHLVRGSAPSYGELSTLVQNPRTLKPLEFASRRGGCEPYYQAFNNQRPIKDEPYSKGGVSNKKTTLFTNCACIYTSRIVRGDVDLLFDVNVRLKANESESFRALISRYDDDRSSCRQMDPSKVFGWARFITDLRDSLKQRYASSLSDEAKKNNLLGFKQELTWKLKRK